MFPWFPRSEKGPGTQITYYIEKSYQKREFSHFKQKTIFISNVKVFLLWISVSFSELYNGI